MTTRSPSFRPRDASMALLVACSLLGSTALEMEQDRGAASKSICLISLAVAAASAISRGMSTGSGTTSAGICPLSFYHRDKEKKNLQLFRARSTREPPTTLNAGFESQTQPFIYSNLLDELFCGTRNHSRC